MRLIPEDLQTRLDSGVTTLARAWILRLANGDALGFTEHDEDLIVEGVLCRAGASFDSGDLDGAHGLQVDSAGWSGALSADGLNETALSAGAYDNAQAAAFLVDWTQPDLCVRLWSGTLGEVRRGELGFEAELKGPSAKLSAPLGRIYTRNCDADLGDARCGVTISAPAFSGAGAVTGLIGSRRFRVSGLNAFASGLFSRGLLRWTDGGNDGAASEVVTHAASAGGAILELLEANAQAIQTGDSFTIQAGCDKSFATCRSKFSNQENFRGFPHMPGDDSIQAAPASGAKHDGGSRQ